MALSLTSTGLKRKADEAMIESSQSIAHSSNTFPSMDSYGCYDSILSKNDAKEQFQELVHCPILIGGSKIHEQVFSKRSLSKYRSEGTQSSENSKESFIPAIELSLKPSNGSPSMPLASSKTIDMNSPEEVNPEASEVNPSKRSKPLIETDNPSKGPSQSPPPCHDRKQLSSEDVPETSISIPVLKSMDKAKACPSLPPLNMDEIHLIPSSSSLSSLSSRKVSQRNDDRLEMAKEIFLRYVNYPDLNNSKDYYTEIIPVTLHLTNRCWKEFKSFAAVHGYRAKRRRATSIEKGSYDKSIRDKYIIGVARSYQSIDSNESLVNEDEEYDSCNGSKTISSSNDNTDDYPSFYEDILDMICNDASLSHLTLPSNASSNACSIPSIASLNDPGMANPSLFPINIPSNANLSIDYSSMLMNPMASQMASLYPAITLNPSSFAVSHPFALSQVSGYHETSPHSVTACFDIYDRQDGNQPSDK